MKKTIPLIIIASIVILVVSIVFLKKSAQAPVELNDQELTLYVSKTCPHCRNVEDFIEKNGIKEKISFSQKEISQSIANAREFSARGAVCQISPNQLGVPLFWNGEKCLMGDQEIIQYFSSQINEK